MFELAARCPRHADRLNEALDQYTLVLQRNPESVEALYHTGNILERQNLLDQAIATYSRVLELEPGNARAAFSRGACYNVTGDIVRAIGETAYSI